MHNYSEDGYKAHIYQIERLSHQVEVVQVTQLMLSQQTFL